MRRVLTILMLAALLGVCPVAADEGESGGATKPEPMRLSLEESIDLALENNRWRTVSQLSVEIAEAQLKQALSAYWPQVDLRSAFTFRDEDPTIIQPSFTFPFKLPAAFQLLFPPNIQMPTEMPVEVPPLRVKLMDRANLLATLEMVYPLYTGGLRPALKRQAKAGVAAAQQEVRRTDLQVVYDLKRIYYGAVLARKMVRTGEDALARLEVTLELTENLYKRGSGKVKKTDYLQHKMIVESLRSLVARLRSAEALVRAALVNTMGLPWSTEVEVTEEEIPFAPYEADLEALVSGCYRFNPDWARMKAGLDAFEAKVSEARSGHLPKFALIGRLEYINNDYDAGVVPPEEKTSWLAAIGMELPVFHGFRTRNEVREARARLEKLENQKVLLREGLALQIQYLFLQLTRAQEEEESARTALEAAQDNRRLTVRAYQDDLMEVQDVITAQLMESFMTAKYEKTLYDHMEGRAHLGRVVGEEIERVLGK